MEKEPLSEPWFTLTSLGLKTIEGRKNKGRFKDVKVGSVIEWVNDDFKHRSVSTRVVAKREYQTFFDYLTEEGLERCLPGMPSLEHCLSVYFKYYPTDDEEKYGVVAMELEKL